MEKKNTPFWDSSLPIEKRLDWLLARMTIEEKLNCLSSRMPALERLVIDKESVVKVNFDHELVPMLAKVMGPIIARNMAKRMKDVQH